MFSVDRVFAITNQKTGVAEWYFQAREGDIGPYESRKHAELMLKKFIETCIEHGFTGGRGNDKLFSSLQIQTFLNYEARGDFHWH